MSLRPGYGLSFKQFMQPMTLATLHACNVKQALSASSSSNLVRCTKRWVGCYVHGLDTVMKHNVNKMASGDDLGIWDDVIDVEDIIRIAKHSDINMPRGYTLNQDCKTRYGTTCDVVERFLKSMHHLRAVENESVHVKFRSCTLDQNNLDSYPELEPLVVCFSPSYHVQTNLETAHKPTSLMAFTMHVILVERLRTISLGMPLQRSEDLTLSLPMVCHDF